MMERADSSTQTARTVVLGNPQFTVITAYVEGSLG